MDTRSPTNTFSGSCSESETCFSEFLETMPDTAIVESRAARMMNSKIIPRVDGGHGEHQHACQDTGGLRG